MNEKFLVGAATAAHQVEGNNTHCDFWVMENLKHSTYVEPSGMACDHYNRYKEDIKLLADAGLNAYRFSIEWQAGYSKTFGLIAVDRTTQKRYPKESLQVLGRLAREKGDKT